MEIPDIPLGEDGDRFQVVMAIMIAVVTLVGAVLAWQAAVAADNAGDADFAGISAILNVEETRTINDIDSLRHYRAFTSYNNQVTLREQISAESNPKEFAQAGDLASVNQIFFPSRYLNRDGSYALQRQLGETWAQAAQVIDLDPQPHFEEGDALRNKTIWLVGIFILLSLSLMAYTLAEAIHPLRTRLRMGLAIVGTLFLFATIGASISIELLL